MITKAIKALTYVWTIQKLETVTQDFGGLIFTTAVQEGKKKVLMFLMGQTLLVACVFTSF